MSDEPTIPQKLSDLNRRLASVEGQLAIRLTAIEAELAVMRGTQSAPAWAGDSARMTIEPADERRD